MHAPAKQQKSDRQQAFTLVEVMVALTIAMIVGAAAISVVIFAARSAKAGGNQVRYATEARRASNRITRAVENAKAVSAKTNSLELLMTDMTMARIVFDDGGNPNDLHSNRLLLMPTSSTNNATLLSNFVSAIPGEPMFGLVPTTPRTARIAFRVGDGTNDQTRAFSSPGAPLQGVEVRISVTPRNLQRWYEDL